MTSEKRPSVSRTRLWMFRAITFSLPFIVLTVVEIIMRCRGLGGYPAFLREAGKLPGGETVCIVEPAASKPYFYANPNRPGYAEQTNFLMPKPQGTVRIFLVGESAAKGYPQPRNLSMASFLREILTTASPDRNFEIIDLGTTAVASFPLVYQVRDALRFSPDFFVFYMGNNEFFGAYGTGSINTAGTLPLPVMRILRGTRGLALVQSLDSWIYGKADSDRTLMEQMIGHTVIPHDSPLRAAAARNLRENLRTMLMDLSGAGVPALVCTTASNESGLAPLGIEDLVGLDEAGKTRHRKLLEQATQLIAGNPSTAIERLSEAVSIAPHSAGTAFLLGRAHSAAGDPSAAREAFLRARDLDTMPWRPVSSTEQAIREAASAVNAPLCDIAEIFRQESPEGATGWALMDDHVHLSLVGQARAARAMAAGLAKSLSIDESALQAVPDDATLARKLGSNYYDTYRVNHTLRVLFGVSFMRESNPEAYARFSKAVEEAESEMPQEILEVAHSWQTMTPHAGGLRPITGMIARVLLRQNRAVDALPLYDTAAKQVPDYTSWYIEYVYFSLACRERLDGLREEDHTTARHALVQGRFLLAKGDSQTGLTERYLGRIHQLLGEWEQAIPLLLAARPKLSNEDLVACDQALVASYIKTGKKNEAQALVDDGIKNSDKFSSIYTAMGQQIR